MDAAEFDEFYLASRSRIIGQLYAMIGDRTEAEECTQEAFARAWQHRRTLENAQHPEAWVRITAHRLAISRWRRVVRGRRPPDRAVGPTTDAPGISEDHVAVVTALRQLPERQRQVLVLHHIADLPVDVIAREIGVPSGTVKARLSRGRHALATLLDDASDQYDAAPTDPHGGARHA